MSLSIYGKLPSGERLRIIKNSPNYKNGSFQNISKTNAMAEDASFFKTMREFLNKSKNVKPPKTLPFVKTDLKKLPDDKTTLIWFGHSSYLLKINGLIILVDPVFSGNAAPISFMVKAFDGSNEYQPEDFPKIDILLLTHDHYDHLDYKTVVKLKLKINKIVCSLGVGSHLEHWGFSQKIIHELDWWETFTEQEINLTATPGRHFSGRGIKRGQSLWSAFILKTKKYNLFLGGDSGYDTHFKTIGEKFGPFDLSILECGQYNKSWPNIHMMPEETAQAAIDIKSNVLLPVHWGKFTLAMHDWDEPINRLTKKAEELNLKVATPKIGEPLVFEKPMPSEKWWNFKSK
ncbi:MBL fold metallo-hydrolase [Aurantibacillus circumpalustris]|uniref:MBL fold metallo-hydrolase n=1 Tax=Aurantibacillus circumpalustris TaxID=3036359 RepID=UPI00295C390D|nr:MBL fold metallo-hydrolase [Aurantibacillus circumpalustris]